jgi:hypothetical protein
LILPAAAFAIATSAAAKGSTVVNSSVCDNLPHSDHPKAVLTNGKVEAVIYLPDAVHGYYRASRFDWGGVIGCVGYRGHTYFGEWFSRYDPTANDSITGPVEEFRAPQSELGYDDAAPGGSFLKIGVGVLQRINESPYSFGAPYPILDGGVRTVRRSRDAITFTQVLHTDFGYAYRYEKTVRLNKHGAVLSLEHKLKNLGTKTIETAVYDHDFFMLDHRPTGPGMVVHLGFAPIPETPFPPSATIVGNDIVFNQAAGRSAQGYLSGYTGKTGEYQILLEDMSGHVGIEQSSDSPLSKFYFWSTPKTICPEAYIAIHILPGKTQKWTIRYHFKAE